MRDIDMERLLGVGLENIDNDKYNNFEFLTQEYDGGYFAGLMCSDVECCECPLHYNNWECIDFNSVEDFMEYKKAYKRLIDLKESNELDIDVNEEV